MPAISIADLPLDRRYDERVYRFGVERVERTCRLCGFRGERDNPQNFFYRESRGWLDSRCQQCRRARDRVARSARSGNSSSGAVDERKFGVEIEYIGSYDELIVEMRNRGLSVQFEGYTHRVRPGSWKIVTDGSISRGFELVSPPLQGAAGRREVELACESLAAAGCRVDRQCGLHVHHEVRDLDLGSFRRFYRNWMTSQRAIDNLVAPSRRGCSWAQPVNPRDMVYVERLQDMNMSEDLRYIDRYRSLNINCFPRYGTAEIRQHQGSMNAKKILAWIEFGQAFIRRAVNNEAPLETTDTAALLAALPLAAATARYLRSRADHFGYVPAVA